MNVIHIKNLPKTFSISDFISNQFENGVIDIEFIYGSNFKNTKLLRDFVDEIFLYLSLPTEYVIKLILIVDELNNNAIEYGTEVGGYNKMRIKCSKDSDQININIEVEDTGKGKKHKNALEMETLRAHQLKLGYNDHKSIRGRGLFMIVVKTVDRLYFRDTVSGGLIVGIRKNIKK